MSQNLEAAALPKNMEKWLALAIGMLKVLHAIPNCNPYTEQLELFFFKCYTIRRIQYCFAIWTTQMLGTGMADNPPPGLRDQATLRFRRDDKKCGLCVQYILDK